MGELGLGSDRAWEACSNFLHYIDLHVIINTQCWELPGGLVVRIRFHAAALGFNPWSGN